jgi:hypothetical protein
MASILPISDTCEKTERGYFSSAPIRRKTLSVFQNYFSFPGNSLERQVVKLAKSGFLFGGKWFWRGKLVFRTPLGGKWY